MKRTGGLWESVVSWGNLVEAARRAALGKKQRPDVAAFLCGLEPNLAQLRRDLLEGSYAPGPYRVFWICEPKRRQISAAPFRDRVVHHALTQVLEPIFERRFHSGSFACRVGKGSHAALASVRMAAAAPTHAMPFALRGDIRKYFASIDHQILEAELDRVIKCRPTLDLASRIISGSNAQEPVEWYFPGDNLFTPGQRRRGLPLGNQTSQFFANVYLNRFDHFIARDIQPAAYARYVDDFILLDDDMGRLREALPRIGEFLAQFRLLLHPGKSRLYRVADGVTWLGWRVFPDRIRLVRPNVVLARRRLKKLSRDWAAGLIDWATVQQGVQAWIGHAMHGDTFRLREQIFDSITFPPRPKKNSPASPGRGKREKE